MPEKVERNLAIYAARLAGERYPAIGKRFGISENVARKAYIRECHRRGILKTSWRRDPEE